MIAAAARPFAAWVLCLILAAATTAQPDRPPAVSIDRARREYAEAVAKAEARLLASYERAIADAIRRRELDEAVTLATERADFVLKRDVPVIASEDLTARLLVRRFVSEMSGDTLTLGEAELPDSLRVDVASGIIRIHGESNHGTTRVRGRQVGHIGKAVIFEAMTRAGVVRADAPRQADGTAYHLLAVTPDGTITSHHLPLEGGVTCSWAVDSDGGKKRFRLVRGVTTVHTLDMPDGPVRLGFAATVRRPGDRADLLIAAE